jgi:hypothetical protein
MTTVSHLDSDVDPLITWFKSAGGEVDTTALRLTDFPGQGRGVLALKDLPVSPLARATAFFLLTTTFLPYRPSYPHANTQPPGRSHPLHHPSHRHPLYAHLCAPQASRHRSMATGRAGADLGRADPLHDVGGCPGVGFEVGRVSW